MIPTDYSSIYPEVHGYVYKPLLISPPLCTYTELQKMRLYDVEILNQIIDIKNHRAEAARQVVQTRTPTISGI